MNNNRQLQTNITIGGASIPVIGWQCHLTSYGNLCTFEVTTSIEQIKKSGYEIFKQQQNNPTLECDIYLSDSSSGSSGLVFSGIVDTVDGTWEDDLIEISGRDYSAVLRDTSQTLDKYVNKTVSQVVQGICSDNNITANIQTTSQIAGIQTSTFEGIDWSFSKNPQPVWHVLTQLAEEVDCVVFMDRLKTLHFVSPGTGGSSHTYYWRPSHTSNNPIMKLNILQQSRRCNNFTLFLHGYDRNGKQTIYLQQNVGAGGHIVHKNRQDLNASNMQSIWQGLADEIQRKNTVCKMVVEGNLNLNVNDTLNVYESESNDLLGLSGRNLFITSVMHSFQMPDYGSAEGDGFLTHVTCNQIGSAGSSD